MTAAPGRPGTVGASGPAGPAEPPGSLWRNRDFNLLWSGQALSDLGTQMSAIAYPLLILAVTGSAAQAGIVGSATIAGTLLLLLPAGVAADRWSRKRVMMITSVVQLTVGATVVPALLTHHIYLAHLACVGFAQGGALAYSSGANRGALRQVVPQAQLPDAFARSQARDRAAIMLGPPAGATLFSIAPVLPFAVDALSFAAITGTVALMRAPLVPDRAAVPEGTAEQPAWRRVLLGMRFVFASPYLRMVTIWAALINGVIAGVRLTSIVLARHLGASAPQIGLLFTISAACGLVGAVFARRLISLAGERALVQLVSWTFPVFAVVMAWTPWVWLIGIMAGLTGFLLMPLNVVLLSRTIQLAPDHMQAQMNNAMQLCWISLSALTPALYGLATDKIGPRGVIYLSAGIYFVIAAWLVSRRAGMDLLQRKSAAAEDPAPA